MPQTKLFLVQYIIEADVTKWPEFDEEKAIEHFRPNLSKEDKIIHSHVFLLARKPDERDLLVEEYEDRGFNVEIRQSAETVGTDVPIYYLGAFNRQVKNSSSSISEHPTIEAAKEAAHIRVDKRLERQNKKPK
jgi:hypothetical protein